MPKEYINNRYYGQTALSDTGPVALDDSAIKVGWTKDREHVEVAVVSHRDLATGEPDADAWHSQFDRAGINRLIRTLRKARDEAFGSDA